MAPLLNLVNELATLDAAQLQAAANSLAPDVDGSGIQAVNAAQDASLNVVSNRIAELREGGSQLFSSNEQGQSYGGGRSALYHMLCLL